MLPATNPESASTSASPVTPSPVKDSHMQHLQTGNENKGSEERPSLRPLQLGSFDFGTTTSYIFPSLHSEASSMLDLSLLIYTLSELRDLGEACLLICSTRFT
jgi:hypothetical protein